MRLGCMNFIQQQENQQKSMAKGQRKKFEACLVCEN